MLCKSCPSCFQGFAYLSRYEIFIYRYVLFFLVRFLKSVDKECLNECFVEEKFYYVFKDRLYEPIRLSGVCSEHGVFGSACSDFTWPSYLVIRQRFDYSAWDFHVFVTEAAQAFCLEICLLWDELLEIQITLRHRSSSNDHKVAPSGL